MGLWNAQWATALRCVIMRYDFDCGDEDDWDCDGVNNTEDDLPVDAPAVLTPTAMAGQMALMRVYVATTTVPPMILRPLVLTISTSFLTGQYGGKTPMVMALATMLTASRLTLILNQRAFLCP